MARTKAKTDRNQAEITKALRTAGVSVFSAHAVGRGFPDLICGYRGSTALIEVKDGAKPPSARTLTPAQVEFHDSWRGSPVIVVCSVDEALRAVVGNVR